MSTATATAPAEAPAPDLAPEAPRRSRRLLLIVAAVVFVALGAGAYFLLLAGDGEATGTEAEPEPVAEGPVVEVGTLTTNLAGANGRYARVGIALVLSADADAAAVGERFALVKDAAITEIGRHDAAALQAAGGTETLRDGLAERITRLYPDGEVLRVVLTELLVQ